MDAVKIGRRRVHDLDCDGYRQMKRRLVNGVCHLEAASGGWHISGILPEKSLLTEMEQQTQQQAHQQHMVQQLPNSPARADAFQNGTKDSQADVGRASGPESLPRLPELQPVLPPNLRESERMKFVERWINSIPAEPQLWAQTSLHRIISLSDPRSFPDELIIPDTQRGAGESLRGYDYYPSHLSSKSPGVSSPQPPTGANCSRASPCQPQHQHPQGTSGHQPIIYPGGSPGGLANSRSTPNPNNNNAGSHVRGGGDDSGGFTTSGVGLLGPRQPGGPSASGGSAGHQQQQRCSRMSPSHQHHQQLHQRSKEDVDKDSPNVAERSPFGARTGLTANRFFTDLETQMIVELFIDYFNRGSCPSLNAVRRRISDSVLQVHRNATSIRAKVKRLQTSGRWTVYTKL